MDRIAIVGNSGAGKSTFAQKLAKKLNIKVTHLDYLYQTNTRKVRKNISWDMIQNKLVLNEKWIIDGNFPRTWQIRLKAADTIIFFDFPIWMSLYRVLLRRIKYQNTNRPDMPVGVNEKLRLIDIKKILIFSRPNVIVSTFKLHNKKLIVFRSNNEADKFLDLL